MAEIVEYHEPEFLYRYRSLEKYDQEIKAIKEGYIWCSNYKDKNNPMEGYYVTNDFIKNHPRRRELTDFIQYQKQKIGLCSFAETGANELLWAHYANSFQGIAIQYNVAHLRAFLRGETLARMRYIDSLFEIKYDIGNIEERLKQVLSCKKSKWVYEQEWRLFSDTIGTVNYGDLSCISKIYIGSKIKPTVRARFEGDVHALGYRTQTMKLTGYDIKWNPAKP